MSPIRFSHRGLYWPGLVVLSLASMATAPLGARVAHSMDIAPLKKAFAVLLYGVAIYFAVRWGRENTG